MTATPRVLLSLRLVAALAVALLASGGTTRAATPHVTVTPNPALADQPVAIRVSGLAPGQIARVEAQLVDAVDGAWAGWATFRADAHGTVDVATAAPVAGTYRGVQPMGLLWSLPTQLGNLDPARTALRSTETLTLTVTAQGHLLARAASAREVVAPGVLASTVHADRLLGAFYRPAGAVSAPGVLVLGGAAGGLDREVRREAALLADHGYAALALAYFGAPGLPPTLAHIPLEYFGRAFAWLGRQPGVRGTRLAVVGHSRGGELALVLGAYYPQIAAVVSYVGSGVVHSSTATGTSTTGGDAAWTWHRHALAPGTPIPVERIQGPVLLLAAAADAAWNSAALSRVAWTRLRRAHHPDADRLVVYPVAGHLLYAPYVPVEINEGGDPAHQAAANVDAWRRTLALLDARLKPPHAVHLSS